MGIDNLTSLEEICWYMFKIMKKKIYYIIAVIVAVLVPVFWKFTRKKVVKLT